MKIRFAFCLITVTLAHLAIAASLLGVFRLAPQREPAPAAREPFELAPATGRGAETAAAKTRRRHRVTRGDTYWGIARQYGVSVDAIRKANGHAKTHVLQPGQELLIPTSD